MNKIIKASVLSLVAASLVFPGISSAEEINVTDLSNSNISSELKANPWTNGTVYDDVLKQNVDLSEWNIKYGNEAKLELNKVKVSNSSALDKNKQLENENKFSQMLKNYELNKNSNFSITPFATKSEYRTNFTLVALTLGSFDCPFAGQALNNSLQDNPGDLNYEAGSRRSNAWSLTTAYTNISIPIAAAVDSANRRGESFVSGNSSYGTSAGNAGLDFYLALGKVTVTWAAEKVGSSWKIYIHTYDKYDFQDKNIPGSFPDNIITIANNQAAAAQNAGAIVPYFIHIYTQQTYTAR